MKMVLMPVWRAQPPIEVTANHRLYSLDQDGWVEAGSLEPGARLMTRTGTVRAADVEARLGTLRVFNLVLKQA